MTLTFERAPRGRLDVLTRAVIDLLTATSLIDGDDSDVLQNVTAHHNSVAGFYETDDGAVIELAWYYDEMTTWAERTRPAPK